MGLFGKKPPEIVREAWNTYAYRFGEDERCVVTFDVSACDPAQQKPSQLRRVIGFSPEDQIGPTGMPSKTAFARLKAIEEAMLAELRAGKVRCWLLGTQVYRGFRELLFQVDDLDAFAAVYATVEAKLGGMELVEYPDWRFFNDKISPGVRGHNHIGNREVIAALEEAGSNLAVPHTLEHCFLGPSSALDAIERELAAEGFTSEGRDGDSLTISNQAALDDQDAIDAMTMWLRELADTHGAEYDGWGTAVQR